MELSFLQSPQGNMSKFVHSLKSRGLVSPTRTPPSLRIQLEYPLLKFRSIANFVTKQDKALHGENPSLPIKLQSRLFIANFDPFQELSEVFKVKYILQQKITIEKIIPVKACSATTAKTSDILLKIAR